jgi:hypothetical protein
VQGDWLLGQTTRLVFWSALASTKGAAWGRRQSEDAMRLTALPMAVLLAGAPSPGASVTVAVAVFVASADRTSTTQVSVLKAGTPASSGNGPRTSILYIAAGAISFVMSGYERLSRSDYVKAAGVVSPDGRYSHNLHFETRAQAMAGEENEQPQHASILCQSILR